jgi:hypothetical protein
MPPTTSRHARHLAPSPDQCGSLFEQIAAVALFLAEPARNRNRETAWEFARWRAMPHARGQITQKQQRPAEPGEPSRSPPTDKERSRWTKPF